MYTWNVRRLAQLCSLVLIATAAGCSNKGTVPLGDPCGEDSDCITGSCVSDGLLKLCTGTQGTTKIGGACTADSDCEVGVCILGLPDGYCALNCTSAPECPAGTTCTQATPLGEFACLLGCTADSDCRQGYVCGFNNVCSPSCVQDTDCLSEGTLCDTATQRCSASCSADADCILPNQYCAPPPNLTTTGSTCQSATDGGTGQ